MAAVVRRRSQTQRATTRRPRMQTRAQKRASRIKAELEPMLADGSSSVSENSEGGLKAPPNCRRGRVMFCE